MTPELVVPAITDEFVVGGALEEERVVVVRKQIARTIIAGELR